MNTVQKIAKNTGLLFISQIITYIMSFIALIYTARYLGALNFGTLSFALSLAGILTIFTDIGLSSLMTRELARDKSMVKKYTGNVIMLKIVLSLATVLFSILLIYFLNYDKQTILVVFLVVLSYVLTSFSQMFYSIFQSQESMEYQSLGQVLNSLFLFVGVIGAIYVGLNVLYFAMAYFISSGIVTCYTLVIYRNLFSFPKMEFNSKFCKKLVKEALPLSLAMIFSTIAFRVDTVMLSAMVGNTAVGWYNASYRLIEALMFIPAVFTAAIYPVTSNFYVSSHNSLKIVYKKSFEYLTILSIPLVVAVTLLADKIILIIYGGQYIESVIALQILVWSIPFIFLTYMFSTIMISINRQNLALKVVIVSMIFNIIFNLMVIPVFSYVGSSLITVLTELIDFLLYFYFLSKYLFKIQVPKIILKPVIAGMIMGLSIFYIKINFIMLVPLSIFLYFVVLVLLKTFTKEDFDIIKQLISIKSK